MKRKNWK